MSERICRVCLKADVSEEFTRIYANNEVALKLNLIGGITIFELDESNGQAFICPSCLKELFQCFLFRKKCQSSDEYFKFMTAKHESKQQLDNEPSSSSIKDEPEIFTIVQAIEIGSFDASEDLLMDHFKEYNDNEDSKTVHPEQMSIIEPISYKRIRSKMNKAQAKKKTSNLKCQFCGIVLSRRNRLIQHERLHLIGQTQQFYECFICGKTFNQKFGLIPHFRRFHNLAVGPKERWKCAICVDKILPPGNLALHYEKEHSNFTSKSRLSSKEVADGGARKISTKDLSSSKGTNPPRRRRGPKQQKPEPNYWPCQICGNSFSNYGRFKKHLKEIHETNDHEVLQDTAALMNSLYEKIYQPEKPEEKGPKIPCTTCGKVFASVMTVRAHEKTHLNIEYLCDLCGSSFRVKAYLTAHVQKVHMKLKKFKCSFENCSAAFVHRELLNYHVRKHLNIRNFACRYCGKTFTTKNCCTIHERIHTDERPYSCRFCERTFIHHSDHRRHELKHNTSSLIVEKGFIETSSTDN